MHRTKYNWLVVIFGVVMFAGCGGKNVASQANTNDSAEADKVLYERASNDLQHNRYELARLTMQTLINTYPDSEYLAKAKLAIADSYFKEGGTTGLTQAVAEYQDFITFFPFLDEASYAQMQVAMAHYRRMEKADRDRSEALEAEAALQTFLQKYPRTELTPKAEQRLREVQETLAEGDFRIASFYYIRRADKAAAPRLLDLVNRYPLYSDADRANWMLATIYERNQHNDVASTYYSNLVKQYPLSSARRRGKGEARKVWRARAAGRSHGGGSHAKGARDSPRSPKLPAPAPRSSKDRARRQYGREGWEPNLDASKRRVGRHTRAWGRVERCGLRHVRWCFRAAVMASEPGHTSKRLRQDPLILQACIGRHAVLRLCPRSRGHQ